MTSSRFRQIADDLRERVALGEFGDQGALDSESALCARYAVSRVTVRRALETLREQGLVESRQGSGWFATGGSFHQRLALGTFRHAGSAVTESGRAMTRRVVEFGYRQASPALASTLGLATDSPDATDADADALHCRSVRTVDGVPLDLVAEWVPAAIAGRVSRADAADPGIWASLQRDGHRVVSVRQSITAGIASADDAALLDVAVGAPLTARPTPCPERGQGAPRALGPSLPRPPVQPRGRVQRLAGSRSRHPAGPARARSPDTR